jgi:hypothetical protein
MDDASGVKTVQCDQGEARRSGVIPRLLRRLFIGVRRLDTNQSQKIYNAVTCVRFFLFYLVEIGIVKTAPPLKASFLIRVYENTREAYCEGTTERKAVRDLRTGFVACLAS